MTTMTTARMSAPEPPFGRKVERAGHVILRYGLVVILLWIGLLKFTAYESHNIEPLVSNSPLMAWGYSAMSMQGFARLIGTSEILIGLLIATRPFWPRVSAFGSLWAIGMFLITLSFVITTPGVWQDGYGFPFPSGSPGQFLLKDIISVGVAVWSFGEAWNAAALRADRGREPLSAAATGVPR